MLQIINAIVVYAWLILVLVFLHLIWRSVSGQMQEGQRTIVSVALKNAETAQKSAEAALKAADAANALAALLTEREKL